MIYKDKTSRKEYYENNKDKINAKRKKWRNMNLEKERLRNKKYRENNKDKIKNYYIKNKNRICKQKKEYYEINKQIRNKKKSKNTKDRRKLNKNFCISLRLRAHLFRAFDEYTKFGKNGKSDCYGINYSKIIEYLKPFPENLSKYHIDHIRPLCSFNFINQDGSPNFIEIKKAFAPENHQWLLAKDNLSKVGEDKKQSLRLKNKHSPL